MNRVNYFIIITFIKLFFFLITECFVGKIGSTSISSAILLATSILDAKPSSLYFSKNNNAPYNCFMVVSTHIDLDCNFLRTILMENKMSYQITKPSKNSKFSSALTRLSASLFDLASSQDLCNSSKANLI